MSGARFILDEPIGIIGAGQLGQALARTARRRVLFLSGDDGQAKGAVGSFFDAAGFFPIDIGALASGGAMQQWGGALAGHNLVRIPAPWE